MTIAQATYCATLVDEWVRCGVRHAVIAPGSRSTPMAVALASHPALTVHVHLDERSAGFVALGIGASTNEPAVVCVTSGTAAAELHPSIVEADLSAVAMIVVTADRPPLLHGVFAPQTIEQRDLYGPAVRSYFDPGVVAPDSSSAWRSIASMLYLDATGGRKGPGPVQLNQPFVEPLLAEPSALPDPRPDGEPWHRVLRPRPLGASIELDAVAGQRGVLVAGGGAPSAHRIIDLARRLAWPILADPRSRARVRDDLVISSADMLARSDLAEGLTPDVVIRLGAPWASKPLNEMLARATTIIAVDPRGAFVDPERRIALLYEMEPQDWLDAALRASDLRPADPAWLTQWIRAEKRASSALDDALADEGLCEPSLARSVSASLPSGANLVVSSSMPIRDLEWFQSALDDPPIVMSNRGANGIDGVVSTALGVTLGTRSPTACLVGDLAFLHDASALVTMETSALEAPLVVVVADNNGGGIFEFLWQATALERSRFEQLFATPPSSSPARVAAGFGHHVQEVADLDSLAVALREALASAGISVIVASMPSRRSNREIHDRLIAAVREAL